MAMYSDMWISHVTDLSLFFNTVLEHVDVGMSLNVVGN
jgi:hypothetical protein